jgi:hypothetical protein
MKRFTVFGIALSAMLALSALTASGASAKVDDLVLFSQGAPASVGETAYGGITVDECAVMTEGTLTANNQPSDTAAFSTNVEESCGKAGYSITGVVKSAKLSAKGAMLFTSTITLSVPGPCNYSIQKYSVPFNTNTNGEEGATTGEGEVNAKLSKTGSSKSCAKTVTATATTVLRNHGDGLYGTEPTSSWWVEGKLLEGTEPIAEETNVTVPFKLEFKYEGTKAVKIECKDEKIEKGMIEAPGKRSEKAEIFEGCEVVGEEAVCSVTSKESLPGTIRTQALKAKLEGPPGAEKLKFTPEEGETITELEIEEISSSCAEKSSTFKVHGEMTCNYKDVGLEKVEHPLEFTATSGSKVIVEGTKTPGELAVFEVTDMVHLSSKMPWSAY